MRKVAIGLALFGALLMALPVAVAQTGEITIFVEGLLRGDPGDVFQVHTEVVDESLIGATCSGFASTENNTSEHPNNDMILASGGNTAIIPDFEAVANSTTAMAGTLVLGPTIDVSVRLGGGGISSGGILVVLNCAQPEPTTTTTVIVDPTTTTTTVIVDPTTTTSTAPPTGAEEGETPVGGPAAGGGSTAPGGGVGLLMLALGASAIVGAGVLAMRSGPYARRK